MIPSQYYTSIRPYLFPTEWAILSLLIYRVYIEHKSETSEPDLIGMLPMCDEADIADALSALMEYRLLTIEKSILRLVYSSANLEGLIDRLYFYLVG